MKFRERKPLLNVTSLIKVSATFLNICQWHNFKFPVMIKSMVSSQFWFIVSTELEERSQKIVVRKKIIDLNNIILPWSFNFLLIKISFGLKSPGNIPLYIFVLSTQLIVIIFPRSTFLRSRVIYKSESISFGSRFLTANPERFKLHKTCAYRNQRKW